MFANTATYFDGSSALACSANAFPDQVDRRSTAAGTRARGCLSCKLLQSQDDPTRVVLLEAWDRIESHTAAVKDISPEVTTTLMELLDGRPSGEYFHE